MLYRVVWDRWTRFSTEVQAESEKEAVEALGAIETSTLVGAPASHISTAQLSESIEIQRIEDLG